MKESGNRQVRYTPTGEEIQFRPSVAVRISRTVASLIRLAIVAALVRWTALAVQAYFFHGELTGPARYLTRFFPSERWILVAMCTWCFFVVWWTLGSIYELLKTHLQNDRFLLRPDRLTVRRSKILSLELEFKSYEPLELRLRPSDGALEAKNNQGTSVLTNGGTSEDRAWLRDFLQQRYRFPEIVVGTATVEDVGTYKVERRPDQSVFIYSSAASRVGCAIMAALVCVSLVVLSVWLFSKGNGAGFVLLLFFVAFAFAGLGTLNRRSVEASRGRLLVRWSSPAGKFLDRFVTQKNSLLWQQFGEGEYQYDAGEFRLKTITGSKREPSYKIMFCPKLSEETEDPPGHEEPIEENVSTGSENELDEDLDEDLMHDEPLEQHLVLDFTGASSRPGAEYVLNLLSDVTGFPCNQNS